MDVLVFFCFFFNACMFSILCTFYKSHVRFNKAISKMLVQFIKRVFEIGNEIACMH